MGIFDLPDLVLAALTGILWGFCYPTDERDHPWITVSGILGSAGTMFVLHKVLSAMVWSRVLPFEIHFPGEAWVHGAMFVVGLPGDVAIAWIVAHFIRKSRIQRRRIRDHYLRKQQQRPI